MFDFKKSDMTGAQKTRSTRSITREDTAAHESLVCGVELLAASPEERDSRYGATNVELPTYTSTAPFITRIVNNDGSVSYNIFVLAEITNKPEWAQSVADIVHILDYAASTDTVTFHIASPGGVLTVATRITAAMLRTAAHTVTRAIGLVASAGSFIWSYGKERITVPGSVLMFHMSKHGDFGHTPAVAENAAAFTDYTRTVAFDHLLRDGLLTEAEVDDIVIRRRELYISHDDVQARMGG